MDYKSKLNSLVSQGIVPQRYGKILTSFYKSYLQTIKEKKESSDLFSQYLDLIVEQIQTPYPFEPYHTMIREPFDYYRFGIDFIHPLIIEEKSKIWGKENLDQISDQIKKGHNVILFANHQIEPDPQVISLFIEKKYPEIAHDIIFVAGHRVTTDPMAAPFSMGCNLLCIYSKNYIQDPPEQKQEKLLHNQKTLKRMGQLLAEGGKCIYVAPSGGRDRPNENGEIIIRKFKPENVEMFVLKGQHSGQTTHYYPLTLRTYDILPPPNKVEKELGEKRLAKSSPVQLSFGKEIEIDHFPGSQLQDRKERREKRAEYIWKIIQENYKRILNDEE